MLPETQIGVLAALSCIYLLVWRECSSNHWTRLRRSLASAEDLLKRALDTRKAQRTNKKRTAKSLKYEKPPLLPQKDTLPDPPKKVLHIRGSISASRDSAAEEGLAHLKKSWLMPMDGSVLYTISERSNASRPLWYIARYPFAGPSGPGSELRITTCVISFQLGKSKVRSGQSNAD